MNAATATTAASTSHAELGPSARGKVAMVCFLTTEAAFFSTLIVSYLFYYRNPGPGPTAAEVLDFKLPAIGTVCLVTSSLTIALAARAASRGQRDGVTRWLLVTVTLAIGFLIVTGIEWKGLIYDHHVTITTNLFGSTYFTLIGFHAGHVTMGAMTMLVVIELIRRGTLGPAGFGSVELVGWYWHFVDGVWIVLLFVVYFLALK
ncbi:MAG: heme-copper oxidase subunit III [Pirellulales bacterium]|nr:heme-copper oxidase subunit III [Pirellulales bacterium]